MIILPGSQNDNLALANYNVHLQVICTKFSGDPVDVTAQLIKGTLRGQMDQACTSAELTFARGLGSENLSPLIAASDWNVDNPLMYGGTILWINASVSLPGAGPGTFGRIFTGKIDSVDLGGDTVVVSCRDNSAFVLDRWIRIEKPYSGPMADAIDAILFDNGGSVCLTEGTPDWTLNQKMVEPGSTLEAVRIIAQQRGWDLRFFQSAASGAGALRCYDPDRGRTAVDFTLTKNDYISVDKLEISDVDVRNQVRIWYAQSSGAMATYYTEDADSINRHGPRFVQIPMSRSRFLDTLASATIFGDFALADMKDPLADHQVTMPFFPIVELNDFHEYVANDDHYDTNQKWAIAGYTHEFTAAGGTTTLQTRGKPMGAFTAYRYGKNDPLAVSLDDPPAGTYLDGLVFPEGYQWLKATDLTIP